MCDAGSWDTFRLALQCSIQAANTLSFKGASIMVTIILRHSEEILGKW